MPCVDAVPPSPHNALAETLAVSLRTVYRDVADLQRSGVPIEGEAGVGYMLRKGSDIPPLMFTADELEALVVGTRFVRAFGGVRLGREAAAALLKIEAVLPPELRERSERTRIFAPEVDRLENSGLIDDLHAAVDQRAGAAHALPRQRCARQRARDRTAVPGVLGRQLDARRLVPVARGFPQLPAGPDRRTTATYRRDVRGDARARAGGVPAGGDAESRSNR